MNCANSLQQQTATADVLKVISRSTFDLPTVLSTLREIGGTIVQSRQGANPRSQRGRASLLLRRELWPYA